MANQTLAGAIVNDARWEAVQARDAKADGTFVYAANPESVKHS